MPQQDTATARASALRLLARREHSVHELTGKLLIRQFNQDLVDEVVQQLQAEGLVSDARFAEAYVHARYNRGFGPARIRRELQERGIADSLASDSLEAYRERWMESIEQVRRKRFGRGLPADYRERARQSRFLQYRGFTNEQIQAIFAGSN